MVQVPSNLYHSLAGVHSGTALNPTNRNLSSDADVNCCHEVCTGSTRNEAEEES